MENQKKSVNFLKNDKKDPSRKARGNVETMTSEQFNLPDFLDFLESFEKEEATETSEPFGLPDPDQAILEDAHKG